MVSERLRKYVRLEKVGEKIPLHPNVITLISAAVAWLGVPFVWLASAPAWLFILASGVLDAVDGAVARARGLASKRGAFLDSFLDRYADMAYLLYFWSYVDHLVVVAGVVGTYMISYSRCRGEALGVEVRGLGFMERGERTAYLLVASLLGPGWAEWLLLIYAVLVNVAAVYRGAAVVGRLKNFK
ncbi:MAG: CDP-alcohol phosphatidyltransferase family protein [Pyrobaculum sp.]